MTTTGCPTRPPTSHFESDRPARAWTERLTRWGWNRGHVVDRTTVRRAYDELGAAYAAERSGGDGDAAGEEATAELARLDRFLDGLPDDARLLDAGCGPGTPILRHASTATSTVGLDASREQLRLAAGNAPGAALVQGDLKRLPLCAGTVDAVVCSHALIHVPLADHRTVLDEFARILRLGGRLLVTEGPDEWRGSNPDWLGTGVEMSWAIAGADATRDGLRAAGFRIEVESAGGADDGDEEWVYFSAELARPDV